MSSQVTFADGTARRTWATVLSVASPTATVSAFSNLRMPELRSVGNCVGERAAIPKTAGANMQRQNGEVDMSF
jgi:hypothetical protein